jgi:N6-adenosine-specific RNA methylase IME4
LGTLTGCREALGYFGLATIKLRHYPPVSEHSSKPDEARRMIEAIFPNLPKVELFARSTCEGWDVWGQEARANVEEEKAPPA